MEKQVSELLNALGNDPDSVAKRLVQLGHKGFIGEGDNCPLANYLGSNLGCRVFVDENDVTIHHNFYAHTEATQEFVTKFDSRRYPELVLEENEDEEVVD